MLGVMSINLTGDVKEAKADTNKNTVVFDYNMSALSDKVKGNGEIRNYSYQVLNGDVVTHILDEADNKRLMEFKTAYTLTWEVGGNEVDATTYEIFKDTTFVAKWVPITFSVQFYYCDSDKYPVKEKFDTFYYSIEYYDEAGYNVSYRFKPVRDCYIFKGWYTSSGTQIVKIGNADRVNYKLYARWRPVEYGINYHTTGENTKNPTSYNVEDGEIYLYEPTLKGHIFKGWYLDEKLTVPTDNIDGDWGRNLDLYPKWELETYKVTYILPDGTRTQVMCDYGKTASLPSELKKSIFEIVKTDVSRENIEGDTRITITLVNIWWVYLLGVLLIGLIILVIILVKHSRKKDFKRLRKTYQSNASKYAKTKRKISSSKSNRKNW